MLLADSFTLSVERHSTTELDNQETSKAAKAESPGRVTGQS